MPLLIFFGSLCLHWKHLPKLLPFQRKRVSQFRKSISKSNSFCVTPWTNPSVIDIPGSGWWKICWRNCWYPCWFNLLKPLLLPATSNSRHSNRGSRSMDKLLAALQSGEALDGNNTCLLGKYVSSITAGNNMFNNGKIMTTIDSNK